jgi:hypothetical protein
MKVQLTIAVADPLATAVRKFTVIASNTSVFVVAVKADGIEVGC